MFRIDFAKRIKSLPHYLFAEIDRKKAEMIKKGVDIIDLGVGDPDQPTPENIIKALNKSAYDPKNHIYPSYSGMNDFRDSVAGWYNRRFRVKLDSEKEVLTLIGSKEGLAHLPLAFINHSDIAIVPNPAYPVYANGVLFAGGKPYFIPLLRRNAYLPDLDKIPKDIAKKAKIMFINYPNNPTSAVANKDFFKRVIDFAKRYKIVVCHDAAYTEVYFDSKKPISFLEVEGAIDVGIEFHSLSKTYNMTGWRIGFAVGNRDLIAGLGKVKTNIDSGVFQAVQFAGIEALEGAQISTDKMRRIYKERRDILIQGLKDLGIDFDTPMATFYVWAIVPKGYKSIQFADHLLEKAGIVVTPGIGFGRYGEGYFRIALTKDKSILELAVERIKKVGY